MQVRWCLLVSLSALLTVCRRGNAFRLTLARNIHGHLRFPVARRATTAIPLKLLPLFGNRLELVINVAALKNFVNAVLGAPRLNLVVIDRSRERPLMWEVLRGLLECRSLLKTLSPVSILVIILDGPALRLPVKVVSLRTTLWNVSNGPAACADTFLTRLTRLTVLKKAALRVLVHEVMSFLV